MDGTVAASIKQLSATRHTVALEQMKVVGDRNQGDRDFQIETLPALLA